jgi:hypothetical protein
MTKKGRGADRGRSRGNKEVELSNERVPYWPRYYTPKAAAEVSRAEREAEAEEEAELEI